MSYPAHLEPRLRRMRSDVAACRGLRLYQLWRRVLRDIAISRSQQPIEAAIAAIAAELHAEALAWDGVLYPHINAAGRALDLAEVSIRACMKRGMTFGEAVRHLLEFQARNFSFEEKSWPTIKAAARDLGLDASSIQYRIREKGETFEAAIRHRLATKANGAWDRVRYDGREYPSLNAAAMALGLNQASLRGHIARGRTVEEAISHSVALKKKGFRRKTAFFDGVEYRSPKAAAKALGVSFVSVYQRMRKQDETFEEAIKLLLDKKATA